MSPKRRAKGKRPKPTVPPVPIELQIHEAAVQLAIECANQSMKASAGEAEDIVRSAMFVLTQDAIITHRSIRDTVLAGWASNAAAITRTLFDLLIAVAAILGSKEPRLMAFRYFYSGHRRISRDALRYPSDTRRAMRAEMRSRIESLPLQFRKEALAVINEKDRQYFFGEEWRSPAEVLRMMNITDLDHAYTQLSSAAHGGFFGLRLFRDDPDDRGIGRQIPPKQRALSLLLISSRLLVEIVAFRGAYESLQVEQDATALRRHIRAAAGFA